MMGEEDWQLWSVAVNGETLLAEGDRPVIYGRAVSSIWMGPQMQT
jgi:trans-2-enoyl-CoA reductase